GDGQTVDADVGRSHRVDDAMSDEKKTILVVDDDEDFLFQQKVQLEAAGYKVITAPGSKAARALLRTSRPDMAVIDLMMEEMDAGFTLCREIKKTYPDCPVVICTGVANETGMAFDAATDEERAWVKADALLDKPVRFEQLRREIERLIH
ncbi:MAG: response regulator, partial [FCB group bacterium]|nr:response regulator [FCB group bacterium]